MIKYEQMLLLNKNITLLEKYLYQNLLPTNFDDFLLNPLEYAPNIQRGLTRYLNGFSAEEILKTPPIEWHPYSNEKHNTQREILIIGTFPPPSYLFKSIKDRKKRIDLGIIKPPIVNYFYGNQMNCYKFFNIKCNDLEVISEDLDNKGIDFFDIVLSCQRAKFKNNSEKKSVVSDDKNLMNIITDTQLIKELFGSNQNKRLVFTSSDWGLYRNNKQNGNNRIGTFKEDIISAFSLFIKTIEGLSNSIQFSYYKEQKWIELKIDKIGIPKTKEISKRILDLFYYKKLIVFDIRFVINETNSPIFTIVLLPSPSASSNIGITRTMNFKRWLKIKSEQAYSFLKETDIGTHSKHQEHTKQTLNVLIGNSKEYDLFGCYKSELYKCAISKDIAIFNRLLTIQDIDLGSE